MLKKILKSYLEKLKKKTGSKVNSTGKSVLNKANEYKESLSFLYLSISFIVGLVSSIGLLNYDGRYPINVFTFLASFVFFPFVVVFIFGLLVLFNSGFKKVMSPFMSFMKDISLIGALISFGGLLGLILRVTFSDLVFGWTTTLEASPSLVHKMVLFMSYPWSHFFSEAVPKFEFIEATQYYRYGGSFVSEGLMNMVELRNMGRWWPFLSCSILFYGVIPRLLLFLVLWMKGKVRLPRRKVALVVENYCFNYSTANLETLFTIKDKEITLFYSLIKEFIKKDLVNESNQSQREMKEQWLHKWEELVKDMEPTNAANFLNEEQIKLALKKSNKIKVYKVFSDLILFRPYYALDENDQTFKNVENSIDAKYFIFDYCRKIDLQEERIRNYLDEYQKLCEVDHYKRWAKFAFAGLAGAAALAFTGGLAAPIIGGSIGGLLGLSGAAAISHGLALLGMGALATTGVGAKAGLVLAIGGGGLLGGVVSSVTANKIFKDDETFKLELNKILALIECSFFNKDHFSKNIYDYRKFLLDQIKSQNLEPAQKEMAIERINKSFRTYIASLN